MTWLGGKLETKAFGNHFKRELIFLEISSEQEKERKDTTELSKRFQKER